VSEEKEIFFSHETKRKVSGTLREKIFNAI
jgi:hypothetical protein